MRHAHSALHGHSTFRTVSNRCFSAAAVTGLLLAPLSVAAYTPTAPAFDAPLSHLLLPLPVQQDDDGDLFDNDVNNAVTDRVVSTLQNGASECDVLPRQYRIDCLKKVYEKAARQLPAGDSAYKEAHTILKDTARQLDALVTQNIDPAVAPLQINKKTVRPVKANLTAALNVKATAIIQEAETKLLRSTGGSSKRKVHYAKIAQAVGSTKQILRS